MWIGLGLMAGLGLLVAAHFENREAPLKRRMRKLPLADSIANTPENQDVRVSGTLHYVEGKEPLIAPLTGRPCAAWHVLVGRRAGVSQEWDPLAEDQNSIDFILEDGSGRALVSGANISMMLSLDFSTKPGPASERLEAFLRERPPATPAYAPASTDFPIPNELFAHEGILELGETVTVAGSGSFVNDPRAQAGYRGGGQLFRVEALADGELLASDDPSLRRDQDA